MQQKPNKLVFIFMLVITVLALVVPVVYHWLAQRQYDSWARAHQVRAVIRVNGALPATRQQVLEVELARLSALGLRNVEAAPEGDNQVSLLAPGVVDAKKLREFLAAGGRLDVLLQPADIAISRDEETGTVQCFRNKQPCPDADVLTGVKPLLTGGQFKVSKNAKIDKDGWSHIRVEITDPAARQSFAEATQKAVGSHLLYVVDGKAIAAQPIAGLMIFGSITRKFSTPADAATLAALLSAGPLPAPVTVVECEVVK